MRTITKTVPQPSFFSFFNPPRVPEGEAEGEEAEMIQQQLSQDFQVRSLTVCLSALIDAR